MFMKFENVVFKIKFILNSLKVIISIFEKLLNFNFFKNLLLHNLLIPGNNILFLKLFKNQIHLTMD